jgi:UDP-N-acetyl-D-mannosaminuronic acid dehydrogenase
MIQAAPETARAPVEAPDALDLVVVGGCGHVGLPLAMSFAAAGCRVGIHDVDEDKLRLVGSGRMPFMETGAPELLNALLPTGRLALSTDPAMVSRADTVILVLGTPIDEFMNPSLRVFERAVDELGSWLRSGVLVVLRSTVYPGTTEFVAMRLAQLGIEADVVFCPERVAEGRALEEIRMLPQLVGAADDAGFDRATALFGRLGVEIVRTTPAEAEVAKLLNNTWRYVKFAIANQFFEIVHHAGLDYGKVLHAVRHNYPRGADLPGPGFAAGPCLLKDTMQLAAFTPSHFPLGHAAMLVNEGLPAFIVNTLDRRRPLAGRTVGILGMAFKGESDDHRTSLSYKLRKLLAFKGARVLCTDPYVPDPDLIPLEKVVEESDLLIVAAPHQRYRRLELRAREVVDIWGLTGQGIRL